MMEEPQSLDPNERYYPDVDEILRRGGALLSPVMDATLCDPMALVAPPSLVPGREMRFSCADRCASPPFSLLVSRMDLALSSIRLNPSR